MNISSNKKTILVISDVHQDIRKLEYILEKESYDIVVSLGDWFDSHIYYDLLDVERTCVFLKKWIFKPNFYTLWGNHDYQYFYNNQYTICSGFDSEKKRLIETILGRDINAIKNEFLWFGWIDRWLCTHAGVNPYLLPPYQKLGKKAITEFLGTESTKADIALASRDSHWFYRAGYARGGNQKFGGLTWQDWGEFVPIKGVGQLIGHTYNNTIVKYNNEWHNLNIDCNLNEYLIIRNKETEIRKYNDL